MIILLEAKNGDLLITFLSRYKMDYILNNLIQSETITLKEIENNGYTSIHYASRNTMNYCLQTSQCQGTKDDYLKTTDSHTALNLEVRKSHLDCVVSPMK